jgi:hypothetical protein
MEEVQIIDTSVLQNYSGAASGSQPEQFPSYSVPIRRKLPIFAPSFPSTNVRGSAHTARTGGKPRAIRFPIRFGIGMGGEGGKCGGEMRLTATRTGNRIAIMTDELFEFCSAILTNVFKDRHFWTPNPPLLFKFSAWKKVVVDSFENIPCDDGIAWP